MDAGRFLWRSQEEVYNAYFPVELVILNTCDLVRRTFFTYTSVIFFQWFANATGFGRSTLILLIFPFCVLLVVSTSAMRSHDRLAPSRRRMLEDHLDTVRAIRADHTLDLTRHLIDKVGGGSEGTDDSASRSRSRSRFRRPQNAPQSRARTRARAQKDAEYLDEWVDDDGQSASGAKTPDTERVESSMWTRWPLLRGDVHVPEWTLQDEVEALVGRFFREDAEAEAAAVIPPGALPAMSEPEGSLFSTPEDAMEVDGGHETVVQPVASMPFGPPGATATGQGADAGDIDNVDDQASSVTCLTSDDALAGFAPLALHSVTESTRTWLNSLLRAVALARPIVHHTVLYRAPPSDWVTVLEIAGASGLVDSESVHVCMLVVYLMTGTGPFVTCKKSWRTSVDLHPCEVRSHLTLSDNIHRVHSLRSHGNLGRAHHRAGVLCRRAQPYPRCTAREARPPQS